MDEHVEGVTKREGTEPDTDTGSKSGFPIRNRTQEVTPDEADLPGKSGLDAVFPPCPGDRQATEDAVGREDTGGDTDLTTKSGDRGLGHTR